MPTPSPNAYPLDPTGLSPANLIANEDHTITASNMGNYHFVVPLFSPYFADSLVVSHRPPGSLGFTALSRGVDYHNALPYVGATIRTGKAVYGAISFINLELAGTIRISYQTVGGEFTLDLTNLTEITANIIFNPRVTTWEQISGAPAHFPPHQHAWTPEDMVGMGELVGVMNEIRDAILNPQSAGLLSHLTDIGNPHRVSKKQVGLEHVMNYGVATLAETVAGQANNKYITPLGLKAAMSLIDSRQYATIQEASSLQRLPKIVTLDVLIELLGSHGILANVDPLEAIATKPTIIYPVDTGIFTGGQFLRALGYSGATSGAVTRTVQISGNSSIVIPPRVNSVKITGRGAVGTTTATGGNMTAGSPIVTPASFEANAVITEVPATITATEGQINIRLVSGPENINNTVSLNLVNSSSNQRVYSASLPIGIDGSSGAIQYGNVTVIYNGAAPTITNVPGVNAVVTVLGVAHTFEGSANSDTLPVSRSDEVVLDIAQAATITYNCPVGTDITVSWFEPASTASKIQIDTVWEVSNARSFNPSNIIDGTHLGKGTEFSLTAWKPTRDSMVTNGTYFVRAKWKFNDQTMSDWSDIVEFNYQATNVFPPAGQIVGHFCRGTNQWANVADGFGSTTERLAQANSVECGYVIGGGQSPIAVSIISQANVSITKAEVTLIQNGGTHPYQVAVPVTCVIDGFVENIEDDRIRLYLKDSFYSQYLNFKNDNGVDNAKNFRLPYKVSKNGINQDIKVELVSNLSPTALGRATLEPKVYYIKVFLNTIGYNSLFSENNNRTEISFRLDTAQIFRDENGSNFVNQGLVNSSEKSLTATILANTLVKYNPS